MSWIEPVTDRTNEDVQTIIQLSQLIQNVGWDNLDSSVKTQWLSANKGALNALDLNRIQTNIQFLVSQLQNVGIIITIDNSNPTWLVGAYILLSNIDRIKTNINLIKDKWYVLPTTPTLTSTNIVDYVDVNKIEQCLVDMKSILDLYNIQVRPICGKAVCGNNLIL